jgi:PIN domain nuclease of toxin-antitoxin system
MRTVNMHEAKTHLSRLVEQTAKGEVDNGWQELANSSEHAVMAPSLPPLHRDPFDRMLLAQAHVEGLALTTSDAMVAQYPGPVLRV